MPDPAVVADPDGVWPSGQLRVDITESSSKRKLLLSALLATYHEKEAARTPAHIGRKKSHAHHVKVCDSLGALVQWIPQAKSLKALAVCATLCRAGPVRREAPRVNVQQAFGCWGSNCLFLCFSLCQAALVGSWGGQVPAVFVLLVFVAPLVDAVTNPIVPANQLKRRECWFRVPRGRIYVRGVHVHFRNITSSGNKRTRTHTHTHRGRGPQVAKAGFEHKMLLLVLHALATTSPIHTYSTIQFNHLQ
eukprot:1550859-Amphidinium_carterae.1